MTIEREWRVRDGDLFSLGDNTNAAFLHAVPREKALSKMRISVIFRSVDKSFINLEGERRHVEYASGNIHTFSAECIRTTGYEDIGIKEHICDLIAAREIN